MKRKRQRDRVEGLRKRKGKGQERNFGTGNRKKGPNCGLQA